MTRYLCNATISIDTNIEMDKQKIEELVTDIVCMAHNCQTLLETHSINDLTLKRCSDFAKENVIPI